MRPADVLLVVASLVVGSTDGLTAQGGGAVTSDPERALASEERVRITVLTLPRTLVTGRWVEHAVTDSGVILTVRLVESGELRQFPIATIERLERFAGRKRHTLEGALVGGGLGLFSALFTQAACESGSSEIWWDCGPAQWAVSIAGTAAFGALIGSFIRSDRWDEVPIPALSPRVSVGAVTTGARGMPGLTLGVSW